MSHKRVRKNRGYGAKVKAGNQMYGTGRRVDGCCAHRITHSQVAAAKERTRIERGEAGIYE